MIAESIKELLSIVPDVVWSGLLASAMTLGGVLMSNRSNTTRLRIQLKHDATEKTKERTGKLRQDVLLQTAEAFGRANRFLSSLPTADITKINISEEMQGLFTVVAKLQLVAEPSTALVVNELSASYGAATLRLLSATTPLRDSRIDMEIATKLYERENQEIDRYLSLTTDMIDSGEIDKNRYTLFESRINFHQERANLHEENRQKAFAKNHSQYLEFIKILILELKPISTQYVDALIAIRADLGLPADRQKFDEQMKKQWELMEYELEQSLKTIHRTDTELA